MARESFVAHTAHSQIDRLVVEVASQSCSSGNSTVGELSVDTRRRAHDHKGGSAICKLGHGHQQYAQLLANTVSHVCLLVPFFDVTPLSTNIIVVRQPESASLTREMPENIYLAGQQSIYHQMLRFPFISALSLCIWNAGAIAPVSQYHVFISLYNHGYEV
jgi:hypothetical protein